jgi:hypothetical protein
MKYNLTHEDGRYKVYRQDGKLMGSHPTLEEANDQYHHLLLHDNFELEVSAPTTLDQELDTIPYAQLDIWLNSFLELGLWAPRELFHHREERQRKEGEYYLRKLIEDYRRENK